MNVLESPCKTVLYRPATYEAILVAVDDFEYDLLKSVGQEFCNKLEAAIE